MISDTNPLDGGEEKAFDTALRRRGLETFVVPVERSDWLKVASAVITLDFWRGTCRPDGPAYNWYLQRVGLFIVPSGACCSLHRRTSIGGDVYLPTTVCSTVLQTQQPPRTNTWTAAPRPFIVLPRIILPFER